MSDSDSDSGAEFGPSLPPDFEAPPTKVIGPTLPPNFKPTSAGNSHSEKGSKTRQDKAKSSKSSRGRDVPKEVVESDEDEDEDGDEMIGPLLPEDRGLDKFPTHVGRGPEVEDKAEKREEWMTVIPKKTGRKLGFQSVTSFSRKQTSTDELPQKAKEASEREKQLTEALKEYSKQKRPSSLVELHQEKLKKQKNDGGEKAKARQPLEFNPEDNMSVKKFTAEQQKGIMDKAKFLNSRFSAGSSKFL
jgi:hypothetical protein